REPAGELVHREQLAPELLLQLGGVGGVVAVAVRDVDRVRPVRLLALRPRRTGHERVDVDALAGVRVEPERCVTEPGECRHLESFPFEAAVSIEGPSGPGQNLCGQWDAVCCPRCWP